MKNKLFVKVLSVAMSIITLLLFYETVSLSKRTNAFDIQVILGIFTLLFTYTSYKLWTQKETKDNNKQ